MATPPPPAPGAKYPDRYPTVGPRYLRYGEQPGYLYDYRVDDYIPDPKEDPRYEKPKEGVTPLEGVGYGAAAIGAGYAVKEGVRYGIDSAKGDPDPKVDPKVTPEGTQPTQATAPTPTPQPAAQGGSGLVSSQPTTPQGGGLTSEGSGGITVASADAVPAGYQAVGTTSDGAVYAVPDKAVTPTEGGYSINPAYLQGAVGALQLYKGYQSYKEGDKLGAGVYGTAGAVNVAAAAGSSTAGSVAPYVGAALAGYNIYNTFDNDLMSSEQKATRAQQQVGLAFGDYWTFGGASLAEGWLREKYPDQFEKIDKLDQKTNPITMIAKEFGSSKDSDQLLRDHVRDGLEDAGLFTKKEGDSHHYIELADGTLFDVGVDGKNQFTGLDGEELHPYDVDFSNPEAVKAIEYTGPLSAILMGQGEGKIKDDFTGYFVNASISNGDAKGNALHFYNKLGLDLEQATAAIDVMEKDGKVDAETANAYRSQLAQTFDGAPAAPAPEASPGAAITGAPAPGTPPPAIDTSQGANDPANRQAGSGLVSASEKIAGDPYQNMDGSSSNTGAAPIDMSGMVPYGAKSMGGSGLVQIDTSQGANDPYRVPQSMQPQTPPEGGAQPYAQLPAPQAPMTPEAPTTFQVSQTDPNTGYGPPGLNMPGWTPVQPLMGSTDSTTQVAYTKDPNYIPGQGRTPQTVTTGSGLVGVAL